MHRTLIILLVFSSTLFAKEKEIALSCGCPSQEFAFDGEPDKRCLPGAINGVLTSMKCCPGIWAVSTAALAVGGVAYLLSDSPSHSSVHFHP